MGKNQAIAYMQLYKKTGDDRYLQLYNLEVGEAQGHITKEQKEEQLSIFKKAFNFTKASVKHIATGFNKVDPKISEKRMEICKSCEFYQDERDKDNPSCQKCGCFLAIKTTWASQACPVGKWPSYATNQRRKGGCGGCGK
jgi:hypothetical protein